MIEHRPTPFKINLESDGEHNGWLDDFIDLIRRLYNGDSPYTYDKINIVIEIDGINDTGHFTSTVHYTGVANLKDYKNE